MATKKIETITNLLPDFLINVVSYLKNNFDEHGKDLLDSTTGTAGLIIKLFSQPLIDKYFSNLSKRKLENYGFFTYFKAGLEQAKTSLTYIENELPLNTAPNVIFEILNESLINELNRLEKEEIYLLFQPIYHPVIKSIKESYIRVLRELTFDENVVNEFLVNYNDNIENTIIAEFGTDYQKHLKNIETIILKDQEIELLLFTIAQAKIGFKEDENLKYQKAYGSWERVFDLRKFRTEDLENEEEFKKREDALKPVEVLIDDYFNVNPHNNLDKILFLIADFGKGKSVFMKHYASQLAQKYLNKKEGYIPIYFNLRDFKHYSSETSLGVISDYLHTRFSIKIDDEYFKNKRFLFLIDSLDESGELNKKSIDNVMSSLKRIQNIDKTTVKNNRLIVTSRPFDDGLIDLLENFKPFTKKNSDGRDIAYYLNVYGFKKNQFNEWLQLSLSNLKKEDSKQYFIKKVVEANNHNIELDIYSELLENGTLSRSELRRPIFAYMIYQLIINDIDFLSLGKLGVYLSFLNLLTKEAKHIHDADYKINLKQEFEFRNLLHATSSLWMFERLQGKQGALQKADICRVIEGRDTGENDNQILERFKSHGFNDIQFLSHSYFGEDNDILHFQHQSFAEILLAEYYIKIFIKYSLDEDADVEDARAKLNLGEPTEQTVIFLIEILNLLKETSVESNSSDIIEKRKLLFPLMASLSIQKYNRHFCNNIKYSWYNQCSINENQITYPLEMLTNWCINDSKINKIIDLASKILDSKNSYLPISSSTRASLFKEEVTEIKNQKVILLPLNIDKWLALLVGNNLYNNVENKKLFNRDNDLHFTNLFELIKTWNFTNNDSSPKWGKNLFKGIDMSQNDVRLDMSNTNFDGIDFSYSYFRNVRCWGSNFTRVKLDDCTFIDVEFISSLFLDTSLNDICKTEGFKMLNCQISSSVRLFDALKNFGEGFDTNRGYITFYEASGSSAYNFYKTISGLLIYGLKNSQFTVASLKRMFAFENEEAKKAFYKKLDSFKQYEKKKLKSRINE